MRTLLASALVLLACGCADRSSSPSGADAPLSIPGGPDPVVLRVPRAGGTVSAYAYPGLDSVIWKSVHRAPPLSRIIAFGPDDGYIAAVDSGELPVRIDLRLGTVFRARSASLGGLSSFDGSSIYATNEKGELTRFTQSGGDWNVQPPLPASALLPQPDGSLIVLGAAGSRVVVWRIRPPNDSLSDSSSVSVGESGDIERVVAQTAGTVGDRIYFGAGSHVFAINTRDLSVALNVDVDDPVHALAFTPSGDRVFVAVAGDEVVKVVDRFEEGVSNDIDLPAEPVELRMDPLGRTLLVRLADNSVAVVSVAEGRVQGTIESSWRTDLPMVLADGRIAVVRGENVVLVHPSTLADDRVIENGARDYWYAIRWNGLRPRAAGLDTPVEFRNTERRYPDTTQVTDTLGDTTVRVDTAVVRRPPRRTPPARPAQPPADEFTVSFAALLNEKQARDLAKRIKVDGNTARVTTSERAGRTIFRVIMGPFGSRAEAERVGRASGHNYWIYEGAP